jgi:hypothetical protein
VNPESDGVVAPTQDPLPAHPTIAGIPMQESPDPFRPGKYWHWAQGGVGVTIVRQYLGGYAISVMHRESNTTFIDDLVNAPDWQGAANQVEQAILDFVGVLLKSVGGGFGLCRDCRSPFVNGSDNFCRTLFRNVRDREGCAFFRPRTDSPESIESDDTLGSASQLGQDRATQEEAATRSLLRAIRHTQFETPPIPPDSECAGQGKHPCNSTPCESVSISIA